MKITAPKGCDNSPKQKLVKDLLIDLYSEDYEKFLKSIDDQFLYQKINKIKIRDRQDLKDYLKNKEEIIHLKIDQILSHGKFVACNGYLENSNGTFHFAYFLEFKSAGSKLIKAVTLYQL